MSKVIFICGATASGKTSLAVSLAEKLHTEVISADSLLVYKGLNIGTAKPSKEEMRGIRHHMIDVVEPWQTYSVSDYERTALPIVNRLQTEGKVPIVCGGTGFYIQSLLYQSSFGGVQGNQAIRDKYEELALKEGTDALFARLREVDPESAAVLHPNDKKRVIRALEIFECTGKKKSDQHDEKTPRFPFEAFAVSWPREELYRRIDLRVDTMMAEGLIDEVNNLLREGVDEEAQCMQGIGYKEVAEGLRSGQSLETMSDIIKKRTRNYAKRQLTFFKRMPIRRLEPSEATAEEIIKLL